MRASSAACCLLGSATGGLILKFCLPPLQPVYPQNSEPWSLLNRTHLAAQAQNLVSILEFSFFSDLSAPWVFIKYIPSPPSDPLHTLGQLPNLSLLIHCQPALSLHHTCVFCCLCDDVQIVPQAPRSPGSGFCSPLRPHCPLCPPLLIFTFHFDNTDLCSLFALFLSFGMLSPLHKVPPANTTLHEHLVFLQQFESPTHLLSFGSVC